MNRSFLFLILLIFLLSGCVGEDPQNEQIFRSTSPTRTLAASNSATQSPTVVSPAAELPLTPTQQPPIIDETATSTPTETVPPATAEPPSEQPDPEQIIEALLSLQAPVRDDQRLAAAYRGIPIFDSEDPPIVLDPLAVGAQETFKILDVNHNKMNDIEADLQLVSEYAYFWFETGDLVENPDPGELQIIGNLFDEIYVQVVDYFGPERNPGIDGDPRLHVVTVSPNALCGLDEDPSAFCSIAGMVNATDLLPAIFDPRSNEREMFVMNSAYFGHETYLGVLAHEFRHMIEDNYDKSDVDWAIEGSATLAAELLGLPSSGINRANRFLENPDQQLNSWSDQSTATYYGQGFLLNRYIFDRLGQELYLEYATSPLPGLEAIDGLALVHDLELSGESLWLDWLAALAVHTSPDVPEVYRFASEGFISPTMQTVGPRTNLKDQCVHQYAADYFELAPGSNSVVFQGVVEVPLIHQQAEKGDLFWITKRGNYSNPRLTRTFDLKGVDQATLIYDVYVDIEKGYDFAYVSASIDGGQTWQPLVGEKMQGLDPLDNPAGSGLTERFYTGRGQDWVRDSIDLSQFAGEEILLRYEYVTDSILTYGGLAVDNISIPEIGFLDEVESGKPDLNSEWLAEGFYLSSSNVQQNWHVQLITFAGDKPQIQIYQPLNGEDLRIEFDESGENRPPILIVAATAVDTLEQAIYELEIGAN